MNWWQFGILEFTLIIGILVGSGIYSKIEEIVNTINILLAAGKSGDA